MRVGQVEQVDRGFSFVVDRQLGRSGGLRRVAGITEAATDVAELDAIEMECLVTLDIDHEEVVLAVHAFFTGTDDPLDAVRADVGPRGGEREQAEVARQEALRHIRPEIETALDDRIPLHLDVQVGNLAAILDIVEDQATRRHCPFLEDHLPHDGAGEAQVLGRGDLQRGGLWQIAEDDLDVILLALSGEKALNGRQHRDIETGGVDADLLVAVGIRVASVYQVEGKAEFA